MPDSTEVGYRIRGNRAFLAARRAVEIDFGADVRKRYPVVVARVAVAIFQRPRYSSSLRAEAPTAVGEPGVPPIRPAVANAFLRLTGRRVRTLLFLRGLEGGPDRGRPHGSVRTQRNPIS